MIRNKSILAALSVIVGLAVAQLGFAQTKPLKKIRVGVPSVGMGNIITFVIKEVSCLKNMGSTARSLR